LDRQYAKKDPKFVKLLLKYNADPNITYGGNALLSQELVRL